MMIWFLLLNGKKKKFQFTRIKMNVSNIITAQFKDFTDWWSDKQHQTKQEHIKCSKFLGGGLDWSFLSALWKITLLHKTSSTFALRKNNGPIEVRLQQDTSLTWSQVTEISVNHIMWLFSGNISCFQQKPFPHMLLHLKNILDPTLQFLYIIYFSSKKSYKHFILTSSKRVSNCQNSSLTSLHLPQRFSSENSVVPYRCNFIHISTK